MAASIEEFHFEEKRTPNRTFDYEIRKEQIYFIKWPLNKYENAQLSEWNQLIHFIDTWENEMC